METWYKIRCGCGAVNWICGGDPRDITGYDVDVYQCWKCNKCNMVDDECDEKMTKKQMEAIADDGLKEPS